jgi:hypothetical protein
LSKVASGDVVRWKVYEGEDGTIFFFSSEKDVLWSARREKASYGAKSEWIRELKGEVAYKSSQL